MYKKRRITYYQIKIKVLYIKNHNSSVSEVLKQRECGSGYLDISDRYLNELYPLIDGTKYSPIKNSVGVHIGVISFDEGKAKGIVLKEQVTTVSFEFKKVTCVSGRFKNCRLVQVISNDLFRVRESYDLSPLLENHDFHIAFAQKSREQVKQVATASFAIAVYSLIDCNVVHILIYHLLLLEKKLTCYNSSLFRCTDSSIG